MKGRALILSSVLAFVGAFACTPALLPTHTYGTTSDNLPSIVLLTSGSNRVSQQVIEALVQSSDYPIVEFTLTNKTNSRGILQAVNALHPAAIIALGGLAAAMGSNIFPSIPLVYALVADGDSLAGSNVAGVGLDLPSGTEFLMYKLLLPSMRKVVAFESTRRGTELVKEAKRTLSSLSIDLTALSVVSGNSFKEEKQRAAIATADAIWLPNDPGLMSIESFHALLQETKRARKPLLCSSFREYVKDGGTMAATLNFANIGMQVATLVTEILKTGVAPAKLGILPPLGANLVVNETAMSSLGLPIPTSSQPYIQEMVSSSE